MWDEYLCQEIAKTSDNLFYFSSILIEPRFTNNPSVLAPYNFGNNPDEFEQKKLLEQLGGFPTQDSNGGTWPPSIMPKSLWNLIGGFSIEFSPGMYSDPDLSMKLWNAGVRNFKGIGKSKVYHFMSKSTGKLLSNVKKKNKHTFLRKWNITSRIFYFYYLKMRTPYSDPLKEPVSSFSFTLDKVKSRIKLLLISMR